MQSLQKKTVTSRFNGLLPVVIDIETSGVNPNTDGLLELAAVFLRLDEQGQLAIARRVDYQIEPFVGAVINDYSLDLTGIKPFHPLRYAIPERQMLHRLFTEVNAVVQEEQSQRAILVGHNAWFDLYFMREAAKRSGMELFPFHSFTTFDTATLAGVTLGETVLARAVKAAGIDFDVGKAHSAIYDAEKTAELFCYLINNKFSES